MRPTSWLVEWFKPQEESHLEAYRHLIEHDEFPKGFVPTGIKYGCGDWRNDISNKIIDHFVKPKGKRTEV